MADTGVRLSLDAAQRTRDVVREVERAVKGDGQGNRRPPKLSPLVPWLAKTGADGIPAREGKKPGKGTVTLYRIDNPEADEPQLVKMTDAAGADVTLTAFNLSGDEVGERAFVKVVFASGVWLIDLEDCSPDEDDEDPAP